jgi:hypothetical protein
MGRPTRNSTIKHLNTQAWVTGTGGADYCHVLRQASNTSFEVVSSTGVQGICYLATAITHPAQMLVLAWDNMGGSYAVMHLTNHAVKLEPLTGTIFPSGATVAYSLITATPDAVWLENDGNATLSIPVLPTVNGIDPHGNTYPVAVDNNGNALYIYYGTQTEYAWVFEDGSYAVLDQTGFDGITPGSTGNGQFTNAIGNFTVGPGYISNTNTYTPLVWNQQGAYTVLPTTGLSNQVIASGCSSNGSKIVGFDINGPSIVTWSNHIQDPAYPPIPGDISGGIQAVGITPDGNTILIAALDTNNNPRTLTLRGNTYTEIPPAPDYLYSISANNDLSVILYNNGSWVTYNQGFSWHQLPGLGDGYGAYAMDDSGSVIAGAAGDLNNRYWPTYWQNGQLVQLAPIPGNELTASFQGFVNAISRNGVYLLGSSFDQTNTQVSVQWTRKTF